ncbi:hypothetical protein ACH4C6_25955 [Streptomyces sp. NPDC017943]|uniref:hypothetical protein n=1 Tax=Streptomyces sp. NPDC017943 TaxID=3365019 RepID=UPI0037BAEBB1
MSALVVLALTGFSSGRGRGGGHGGDGGGGGCSSSSQDHDSSRSSSSGGAYGSGGSYGSDDPYDDDDDYGSTGGGSYNRRPNYGSTPTSSPGSGRGKDLEDGTARLVSCATPSAPYATVEVSNPNARKATFTVWVTFTDDSGDTVVTGSADVAVRGDDEATVRVEVDADLVDSVADCRADREALVDD